MFKKLILHPMNRVVFVAALLFVSACQNKNNNSLLELNDFKAKVSEPNAQVLDIRSEEEFKKEHIAKAINISTNADFNAMSNLLYSDVPTYIYGNTESEAILVAQKLNALEFKDLFVLKGGFSDWKGAGLPVEAQKEKTIYESDTIPFEVARKGSKLVVVDFNAVWCKPCKLIEPYVHRLHDNRASEVIVYSIDTDKRPDLAEEYKAFQIPLLVYIKNNKEVYRSVGAVSEEEINAMVDKYK